MQRGMHIAAALAALGIGFGTGVWAPSQSSDPRKSGEEGGGTAITFEGGSPAVADPSKSLQQSLGLISFQQFSDARERLMELWSDLERSRHSRHRDLLEHERQLDEIEQILSLANEEELVAFLTGRRFSSGMVSLADISYGALARVSPERAAEVWRVGRDEVSAYSGLKAVMREWVKRDPAAAERWVDGFASEEEGAIPKMVFLTVNAKLAPEQVVAKLDVLSEVPLDAVMLLGDSLALTEMGDTADRILAARDDGSTLSGSLPYFLSKWGSRDPLAATTWFLSKGLGRFNEQEVTTALELAAAKDPSGVLELLGPAIEDHPELRQVAGKTWWGWMAVEGNEEMGVAWITEHAEAAADFGKQEFFFMNVRREDWPEERVDRMLRALGESVPSSGWDSLMQSLIVQFSSIQPKTALDRAVELLPPGPRSDEVIVRAAVNWSIQEPGDALRWSLENIEGDQSRYSVIQSSVRLWAEKDPAAAATFAMALEEIDRRPALSGLGDSWAQTDPDGALAFITGADNADVLAPMAGSAFRYLGKSRSGDRFFDRALELPEGSLRNAALRGLFGGWGNRDFSTASAVITRVPKGEMLDAAILGFNESNAHRDPKVAMELSAQISIPERRDREMIWHGREWMSSSPAEAEAAIRANPAISDSVKAEIFKRRTP
ncbi:MAG: hypothetical protein JNJ70_26375 [Verrucomicrobiales bacterium]|nr:hypothetical protein [Verrucomicrobiales bacterium]